eukprot:scaffold28052_cov68-Cyclotella_meneghiniana.AAC.1
MSAKDPPEAEADFVHRFYVENLILIDSHKFAGFAQSQGLPPAKELKTKSEEEQQLLCMQSADLLTRVLQLSDAYVPVVEPVLHLRGGGYSDDDDFTLEDDDDSDDEDCCLAAQKHLKNISNRKTKPTSKKGTKKRQQDRKKEGHITAAHASKTKSQAQPAQGFKTKSQAPPAKKRRKYTAAGTVTSVAQYSANDLKTLPFSLAAEGQETLLYGQVWPAEYATKKDGTISNNWLCNLCADGDNRKTATKTFRREGSDNIKACHCCLPKEMREEIIERVNERNAVRPRCSVPGCDKFRQGAGSKFCATHLKEYDSDRHCEYRATVNSWFKEKYDENLCFRAYHLARDRIRKAMKRLKLTRTFSVSGLNMIGLSSPEQVDDLLSKLVEMKGFKMSQWDASLDYEEQIQLDHEAAHSLVLTREFWIEKMGYSEDEVPDFKTRVERVNHGSNFDFLTARENHEKADKWTNSIKWSDEKNRWVRTCPDREAIYSKIFNDVSSSGASKKKGTSSGIDFDKLDLFGDDEQWFGADEEADEAQVMIPQADEAQVMIPQADEAQVMIPQADEAQVMTPQAEDRAAIEAQVVMIHPRLDSPLPAANGNEFMLPPVNEVQSIANEEQFILPRVNSPPANEDRVITIKKLKLGQATTTGKPLRGKSNKTKKVRKLKGQTEMNKFFTKA